MASYGKKKKSGDSDSLDDIRKKIEADWERDKDNRDEAISDLKALSLDQWPESVRQIRESNGQPCLTLDHLNQTVNQVINDIRQAKISIKAIGVDSQTDPKLAERVTALMRDIQYQSHAPYVFSLMAAGAVSCGIGNMRVGTRFLEDHVFEQEIFLGSIPYHLAVLWDAAATEPDRSDAMRCTILEFVPTITFKERFPDADMTDLGVRDRSVGLRWATQDGIILGEYYCKKPTKKRLAAFENGTVLDLTDVDNASLEQVLAENPDLGQIVGEREAEGFKVEHRLISGTETLDGPNEVPGRHIPIIATTGNEIHLEDRAIRSGLIRGARDAQYLYNVWRSCAAESIALAPKAKWLATANQIKGWKQDWDNAHKSPKPYLLYNPDPAAATPAPTRVDPPSPPAAIWQEAQIVLEDIKAATGIYDASLGAKSNETSGVAIARRQQEGDVSTFHFSDNLHRSLEHVGKVMIDLIPRIYDTQRIVRILGENDEQDFVPINYQAMSVDGEPVTLNDLSQARFDVRVDIGPSYTTQRLEAADSMLQYMQADPEAVPILRDKILANMDWPGAQEMAERAKKMVPPEVLSEDEQPEPPPPDPAAEQMNELALKQAGAKVSETEGKARKVNSEADALEIENQERLAQDATYGVPPPEHAMPPPMPGQPRGF